MRALATFLLLAPLTSGSARCEPAHGLVVAANQLAVDAGMQILRAGGSAADGAVAVLMVLGVMEPQSAGIGGGAVIVYFDAATRSVTTWDGRETAPAASRSSPDDAGPAHAVTGGRAVGVPGATRMLEALHHECGLLPWADLLAPAIHTAEQGAPISAALARAIVDQQAALRRQPLALSVFFAADGTPLPAGSLLTNPALAQTLRAIATGGANGLMRGPIAAEIATTVRGDPEAGLITTDDLAAYAPRHREALCAPFRNHIACAATPPAGGLIVLQTLGLLDQRDVAAPDLSGPAAGSLANEAEHLALADAARFLADPDFTPLPLPGLLAPAYLADRAALITTPPQHAAVAQAGDPAGAPAGPLASASIAEHDGSSVVIIDAQGNAVSMTATLGQPFGAQLFVHGFLLNAALADFATDPAAANHIEPGKRPAEALSPALLMDAERNLLAVIATTGAAGIEAQALATLAPPTRETAMILVTPDGPAEAHSDAAGAGDDGALPSAARMQH